MSDDDILARWARNTDPSQDPITGEEVRVLAAAAPMSATAPQAGQPPRARTFRLLAAAAVLVVVAVVASLAYASRGGEPTEVVTGARADGSGFTIWGNQWTLVHLSMNRGDLDVPGPNTERAPVLDLTDRGAARFTGCNTGSGRAGFDDGVFVVEGSWSVEEKGCLGADGAALMEIDQVMGELLQRGASVEMTGSTLTLTDMATVAEFTVVRGVGTADGGTVRVRLEPSGPFIEGFEIGLRFETADGKVIASTLWTDFVQSTGVEGLDAYYDSVLNQPVPVGTVTVLAEIAIGPAGPPTPPDLTGDLPCRLSVEVADGETVDVEVLFDDRQNECLRQLPEEPAPDSPTTTTAAPPPTSAPTPSPTTTLDPVPPDDLSLTVGQGYYVDVDLRCSAFELNGIWVLVDGDPSSWQPPGERHEGGTFTLDTPATGTFRGDAQGSKQATFRLIQGSESPTCDPIPR